MSSSSFNIKAHQPWVGQWLQIGTEREEAISAEMPGRFAFLQTILASVAIVASANISFPGILACSSLVARRIWRAIAFLCVASNCGSIIGHIRVEINKVVVNMKI